MNRSALAPLDIASRLDRVRAHLTTDALLVTFLPNVRYLSGFTGSNGTVLLTQTDAWLFTDGRYTTQASEQLSAYGVDMEPVILPAATTMREAVAQRVSGTIGFESEHMSVAAHERLGDECSWMGTSEVVEQVRIAKDEGEIDRIAAACAIADEAFAQVRPLFDTDITEQAFALELEFAMRRLGAEAMSFEPIVAAAERGALPHARPSDALVPTDTLVVCDFGCMVEGYCSDMTRTVIRGTLSKELREIYAVVQEAQQAGVHAAQVGAELRSVDAATRTVVAAAGFGEYYVHGTGHGVGLEIHEAPRVAATADGTLQDRTVVTVEPGIYLPGVGGVRIEDTLVVTSAGPRVLTNSPKDSL